MEWDNVRFHHSTQNVIYFWIFPLNIFGLQLMAQVTKNSEIKTLEKGVGDTL
jgi:hypothetical protein